MRKIIAAGLTPAWQQILLLQHLRLGEVNRALDVHWCASGKVLNVGLALHHLGATSITVALTGGSPGDQIRKEFAATGIPARWVPSAQPTRVCTTVLDTASHTTTELVENAHPVSPAELQDFHSTLNAEKAGAGLLVLTGSLPNGASPRFYFDAMNAFEGGVILDVRGAELLEALQRKPLLVKPNREELGSTLGRALHSETEILDAMRTLNCMGAEWVIVSQGPGQLLATHGAHTHRFTPPTLNTVVNPIGCGDCLTAGLAWGIAQGRSVLDSIPLGLAAAAQNAGQLLPARLNPNSALQLAASIHPAQ